MTGIKQPIGTTRLAYAFLSGLLLTASFPVIGEGAVAWFALVPLLTALGNLSAFDGFRIGLLTGIVHYLTLLYWFVPFLNTYGPFPIVICIGILFLLSSYLAIYVGLFSMAHHMDRHVYYHPAFYSADTMGFLRIYPVSPFQWISLGTPWPHTI